MNAAEKLHVKKVAALRCVICKRFESTGLPTRVHHIAEGSGVRSDFSIAPLCSNATNTDGHHAGVLGFHAGPKAFIRRYRPPGESEFGLLVWANEDLSEAELVARRRA